MSNNTNIHSININSSIEKVWKAITKTQELSKYMTNIKVESNWNLDDDIKYTCYADDGAIMIWNGQEMVWEGKIVEFNINKILAVEYNGSGGIIKEKYELSLDSDGRVYLYFEQIAIDQQTAKNYVEGNDYTLQSIKKYLEK